MAPRIQTVKKYTYHTKSNKVKRFRTPGGKLRFKKIKKNKKSNNMWRYKSSIKWIKKIRKK